MIIKNIVEKHLGDTKGLDESVGGYLHGLFQSLFKHLEGSVIMDPVTAKKLKRETEKLYSLWKKELKGKGLIGW
jgi:hypothetical protein